MPVRFAPFSIPFPRRLQTLSVFTLTFVLGFGPILGTIVFIYSLFTPIAVVVIAYVAYFFLWDFDKPSRGGRRFKFMRRLKIWQYVCGYYPLSLVKTVDLDIKKNYIFGYHPHGVIANGAFGCFATEGVGFATLFPGITPHLLTLMCKFV